MNPDPLLSLPEVEAIARKAHATQKDKAGRPYTEHLEAVAKGVHDRNGSPEQIAAAWLHDAIEDNALTEEWLETAPLTPYTKDVVRALTKHPGEPPEAYATRILETPRRPPREGGGPGPQRESGPPSRARRADP